MFDAPVDVVYVWVGLATVGAVVAGVAIALPDATPPRASAAARAVDAVSVGPPGSHGTHRVAASALKIDARTVSLRNDGGVAHARFGYGPVVPVLDGPLQSVLAGTPPAQVFEDPATFERSVERAREAEATWQAGPETIEMRRVQWEGVDVTLVG